MAAYGIIAIRPYKCKNRSSWWPGWEDWRGVWDL